MSPREDAPSPAPEVDAERLAALPPLPRDEEGPVFSAPWQAQAFALAVKLSEQGHFTWKEWAAALADELRAQPTGGSPTMGPTTITTGWPPWSDWLPEGASPIHPRCGIARRPGPTPIGTRRTASRWSSGRRNEAGRRDGKSVVNPRSTETGEAPAS